MFDVRPYKSVGSIFFGMAAIQVHDYLGKNFKTNKRCSDPKFPTEYYQKHDLFIYYKSPGIVEAVEFARQGKVSIFGTNPFSLKPEELESFLKEYDEELTYEGDSITSLVLGVSFYILDEKVESTIVFEKGYYD